MEQEILSPTQILEQNPQALYNAIPHFATVADLRATSLRGGWIYLESITTGNGFYFGTADVNNGDDGTTYIQSSFTYDGISHLVSWQHNLYLTVDSLTITNSVTSGTATINTADIATANVTTQNESSGTATIDTADITTATISGDATVAGTLGVTGNTTLSTMTASGLITADTITASGLITANAGVTVSSADPLTVDGNATVAGTLGVTGATTVAAVTASGLITANAGVTTTVVNNSAAQTTVTGTTAGSFIASMPEQGATYKKVIIYLDGYENDTTTAQTYTYPTAFATYALITTNSATVPVTTTSLTAFSTAPDTTTAYTGLIIIEGY